MLASWNEVINYLLDIFITEHFISEMNVKILQFPQPSYMTPKRYAKVLLNNALRCDLFYD